MGDVQAPKVYVLYKLYTNVYDNCCGNLSFRISTPKCLMSSIAAEVVQKHQPTFDASIPYSGRDVPGLVARLFDCPAGSRVDAQKDRIITMDNAVRIVYPKSNIRGAGKIFAPFTADEMDQFLQRYEQERERRQARSKVK